MAAIELATGYLTLAAETSQLSKQIGAMFRDAENQAGRTGTAIGKSISSGIQSTKPDLDRLAKDVEKAEARIAAHAEQSARKQEAAKRKVEIAQARVNETTKKYGAESSQALRAADQLATAEQRLEAETLAAENAQQKLNTELANAKEAYAAGRKAADEAATAQEKAAAAADRIGARMARAWASAKSELDSVSKKLRDVGQKFQDSGKKIGDVGKSLTKGITAPIGGAVTAAAGLVGVLGFKRLTGIDTAQGQIRGLGHDVEAVMEEVDKGVTDTSLSMADGAAIARSALATGNIEVGKELEDQIKRVANVSAAYGVEASHAGILLNNVLTKNKVTYGDLRQMVDNQIPVISQLAEHYGVTGDEIEKMAQEGKISIEDLNKVIDTHAGAAALEYAGTWEGVTANIRANLGRLGADMLGGVFTELKDEAAGFLDLLRSDAAKEFAKDIGERLAEAFRKLLAIGRDVYDWFTGLSPEMQKTILAAVAFAVALGPILVVVGKIAVGMGALIKVLAVVTNPIGLIIAAVGLLVGAFTYLWNTNEGFRNFFIKTWEKIRGFFDGIGKAVQNVLGWIGDALEAVKIAWGEITAAFRGEDAGYGMLAAIFGEDAGLKIVNAAAWIGDAMRWLGDTMKTIWNGIQTAVSSAGNGVTSILSKVGTFVRNIFGPIFNWLWNTVIKPIWDLIKFQINTVSNFVLLLFDTIRWTIRNVLGPIFNWLWNTIIKPVFTFIRDYITYSWKIHILPIFMNLRNFINNVLGPTFRWLYDNIVKPVFTFIRDLIRNVWNNGIKPIFTALRNFMRDVLGPAFRWLYDNIVKPVFTNVRNFIRNVWNNGIKPIFQTLGNFIKNTVAPAFKTGVGMIEKAWDGIKKAAGTPVYFVLETVYNQGIKKTFDKVAEAVGSKARLPRANTKDIPRFAKGGAMKHGWKLVGEEGPELIHTGPGYVYTAQETKKMLDGDTQGPVGAMDSLWSQGVETPSHHGIGGFWSDTWSNIKEAGRQAAEGIKKGVEWVRGGLAEAAKLILNPLKNSVKDNLGKGGFAGLYSTYVTNSIDNVVKWIAGKDEEAAAEGLYEGVFEGAIGGLRRPITGPITSGFGASRGRYPHAGIDFAAPIGTIVRAAWNGIVQRATWNAVTGRTGKGMLLDHGKYQTYYGHLNKFLASPGQTVKAGQAIAHSGNTGRSTGPHLHWEIWRNGTPVNPMTYLNTRTGGRAVATRYDRGGWLPEGTGTMLIDKQIRQPEAVLTNQDWRTAEAAIQATIARDGDGLTAADIRDFIDAVERAVRAGSREGTATGIAGLGTTVRNNFRKGI